MFLTLAMAAIFLTLPLVNAAVWAFFLRIGLKWAKAEHLSGKRILATAAFSQVLLPVLLVPLARLPFENELAIIATALMQLLLSVLLSCWAIKILFTLRLMRALQAWLPTLLTMAVSLPLMLFVVRPLVVEPFVAPTNSMAPTILGRHWTGTCDICGSAAYCSPIDEGYGDYSRRVTTICENFHTARKQHLKGPVFNSDRFLVGKFLKPRRWDIVVFQYPEDPSTLYVKRLIGLPGEEIHTDGGKVWANGKELTPPVHLRGIRYASEIPELPVMLFGTKDNPAKLSANEYFVLGDFSLRAKDSRLWEHGADGHPPYAVPESHLRGVATHIYWPPSRIRVLRH